MNKTAAIERLDALESEAAELRKIINQPEQWEPREGAVTVLADGGLSWASPHSDYLLCGRPFNTKEQAERFAKADRAFGRLWQFALEQNGDWEPDWCDDNKKWFVTYSSGGREFEVDWWRTDKYIGVVYFKTEESAQLCADMLNDGRLVL